VRTEAFALYYISKQQAAGSSGMLGILLILITFMATVIKYINLTNEKNFTPGFFTQLIFKF
jgi:hypothetical protein